MALVELGRFYNSFEAGIVRSRLAAEGIEAFLFDMEMSWEGMGLLIPVRVMVDEDELDFARTVLTEASGSH